MNRIFFKGNPYPKGHKIKEFVWNGRLKEDIGLIFDFHLVTDDYYAEDDSEDEEEEDMPDWVSKIVWGNYHRCTMSSTYWSGNGILIGSEGNKFEFQKLLGQTLIIDSILEGQDYDNDELAFNIYLLGHDDCANHKISFIKQHDKSTFDIKWEGKIALSYSGDYEFKYSFESEINNVKFEGISLDKELSIEENKALLKKCLVDAFNFELIENRFILK